MSQYRQTRHPTRAKRQFSTDPPPHISCGTREKHLLTYLSKLDGGFNRSHYARLVKMAKSSVYDVLSRLINKELIIKEYLGVYKLTTLGLNVLNLRFSPTPNDGGVCRERANLSSHDMKFSMILTSQDSNALDKLKALNPNETKQVKLSNWTQHILYFDDCTIMINTRKVIFQVLEIMGDDVELNQFDAISKVLSYVEKLETIGINGKSLSLDFGHYARVKSFLADALPLTKNGFEVNLSNGRKFWIDNSTGVLEDETNSEDYRQRLDSFLKDLEHSDGLISDLDKLKLIVNGLVKLQALNYKNQQKTYK